MKTAKEWIDQEFYGLGVPVDTVEQIQLDAVKHGMTLASDIVANSWNGQPSNYCDKIEAVRDNLKESDL